MPKTPNPPTDRFRASGLRNRSPLRPMSRWSRPPRPPEIVPHRDRVSGWCEPCRPRPRGLPAQTGGGNGPALGAQVEALVAQPRRAMPEEGTVPLPVEEVEFAEPDAVFEEDNGSDARNDPGLEGERPAAPPRPSGPARRRPPASRRGAPGGGPRGAPTPPSRPTLVASAGARPDDLAADAAQAPEPPAPDACGRELRASAAAPSPSPVRRGVGARAGPGPPLLQPGATWAEALSQRPRRKRLKPWFEEAFDEDYLRTLAVHDARPDPARGRVHQAVAAASHRRRAAGRRLRLRPPRDRARPGRLPRDGDRPLPAAPDPGGRRGAAARRCR